MHDDTGLNKQFNINKPFYLEERLTENLRFEIARRY